MNRARAKWTLVYALHFGALYVSLFALYVAIESVGGFLGAQTAIAQFAHSIFSASYPQVLLSNTTLLHVPLANTPATLAVDIAPLCIGFFPLAAFWALVWAMPGISREKKWKCTLWGTPALIAANLARILGVLYFGAWWGREAFDLAHLYLFQYDLMLAVLLAYALCMHFLIGKSEVLRAADQRF